MKQVESCLSSGDLPAFYTSILKSDAANYLAITPGNSVLTNYKLSGWLESVLLPPAKNDPPSIINLQISVLNIRGRRVNPESKKNIPTEIFLSRDVRFNSRGKVLSSNGQGQIKVPLKIYYPELRRYPRHVRPTRGHVSAHAIPLRGAAIFAVEFDLKRGGFAALGELSLPDFPPHFAKPVLFPLVLCCSCDPDHRPFCKQLCVSIKVGLDATGNPVLTNQQIQTVIDGVNDIWGCGAKGQCCIEFRVKDIVLLPAGFTKIELNNDPSELSLEAKRLLKTNRDPDCYNLYFPESLEVLGGPRIKGFTQWDSFFHEDFSGSIVPTTRLGGQFYGIPDITTSTAHELGHALGLEELPKTANKTLLMYPGGDEKSIRITSEECDDAAGSRRLTKTDHHCTRGPTGGAFNPTI